MAYHVSVAAFSGPFDLLLHLIARHRVDIYEIPIAEITDSYLAALRDMEQVDLELATEFLVVAATLIELKAARLLPVDESDEDAGLVLEMRDLLYARLLDYRTFRQAAADVRRPAGGQRRLPPARGAARDRGWPHCVRRRPWRSRPSSWRAWPPRRWPRSRRRTSTSRTCSRCASPCARPRRWSSTSCSAPAARSRSPS